MDPGKCEGRPGEKAATTRTLDPDATVAPEYDDLAHWYDTCDWWTDPALAYMKGLVDGGQLGHAEGYAAASKAVSTAIAEAAGPLPAAAGEVVARLVKVWNRPVSA